MLSIHGKVRDAQTKEGLPYATVQLDNDPNSTRTDIDGNFFLESGRNPKKIRISYVGYSTREVVLGKSPKQELQIDLEEKQFDIKEVTIRPGKYSRKNNPAVDLIEEVFKHKNLNRKEGLDYYQYDAYEKLEFNVNGINDRFRKRWYLRKFQFIFDHVDTNKVDQKVALPFYLRERILQVRYRRNPKSHKELLQGERQTVLNPNYDVDEDGISAYLNNLYQEVDIYEGTIPLLTTEFIGPLSGIAPTFYRFYITDTVEMDGRKYADVFFAPKNKNDLAFMGNLLVALDSSFAVKRVEMGISKNINLNFVTNLHIEQEYEFIGTENKRRLMLSKDAVTMDFNIWKNADGRSFLAKKSVSYKNYSLNAPLPDSIFGGKTILQLDTGTVKRRPTDFWLQKRHAPLNEHELAIGAMIDSIQRVRAFKNAVGIMRVLGTGYQKLGWFELGPLSSLYSFNGVEGNRFRLGGRTNAKLTKNMILEGYLAFGSQDLAWKGSGSITYAFGQARPRRFPFNQLLLSYQRDLRVPGQDIANWQPDNFLLSFQRGVNNKMVFFNTLRLEYDKEFRNGLSFAITAQHRNLPAAGVLQYTSAEPGLPNATLRTPEVFETGFGLRFAPNEKFYQGKTYRLPMLTKFPVFSLSFRMGIKGLAGSAYNYQRLSGKVKKTFFVAPFGRTEMTLEATRIFGSLPYPMLEIPRANQSYTFDWNSYNLMNFLEFVNDRYASVLIHHNLNGFILNKIPLLKTLDLREVFSFKLLYGGLSAQNQPDKNKNLPLFPKDASGNASTFTMGRQPYAEFSVGISNIFKVLRVDYVQRLNYLNLPNVSNWGIRFSFQAGL
ncbi:MAG: carboxypeptidase-like regulatory domain-containing protein [Bacteroidetes bacterium]|nr:carboxypeptidase-like regulatory domain-containing protein [Bacteroidota bacterium]